MNKIVSSQAMRQCEEANFAAGLADPVELMKTAGENCAGIFMQYCRKYPEFKRVVIFAGHGNNGGDGVVIASVLAEKLNQQTVLAPALPPEKFSSSGKYFFARLHKKVALTAAEDIVLQPGDLVIDALLGTGCAAPMREPYKSLINRINASSLPVFSVDLPSGLGADVCVKADMTAAIGCFKEILFTPDGIENSGALRLADLPLKLEPETHGRMFAAHGAWFRTATPAMPRNIHKYQRGNVLIAAGSSEYLQAPFLTARAALRCGAGLVRLAVPFTVPPACGTLGVINQSVPNANGCFDAKSFEYLQVFTAKANCIAAGPGMGRNPATTDFIARLTELEKPLILDADAIYHAAAMPEKIQKRKFPTVMTPHRGEAGVLAQALDIALPDDSAIAAAMLAEAYNAVVLLKGARTAIASPDGRIYMNTSGTPALATAGSGDVLTGIIAGMIAQNSSMIDDDAVIAAARGAYLHGLAGEMAELEFGQRGVIADDLADYAAMAACRLAGNQDIFG